MNPVECTARARPGRRLRRPWEAREQRDATGVAGHALRAIREAALPPIRDAAIAAWKVPSAPQSGTWFHHALFRTAPVSQNQPASRAPEKSRTSPLSSIFDLRHTLCTPAAVIAFPNSAEIQARCGFPLPSRVTARRRLKTRRNAVVVRVSGAVTATQPISPAKRVARNTYR